MNAPSTALPWYRYPMMWLVIAPPVLSVIAGVITACLILRHPDTDVRTPRAAAAIVIHGHASGSVVPPAE